MKIITKEEADGIKFLFRHHAIDFHFGTEIWSEAVTNYCHIV